ncbi:MAG: protein translocase subunit SecD [Candidatus Levybacteria bacterium]|nr:protein translocase subunit SecD [Candidatus Levybacteria bacterium]
MKRFRLSLLGIILLLFVSAIINIPPEIRIDLGPLNIHKTFSGFNPNFFIGSWHLKRDLSLRRGLDLAGGTSITLQADMKGIPQDQRASALESAKNIIERRINFFGVSEPVVQTALVNQEYRVIVEMPGVTDVDEAVRLVGTTAKLSFWEEGASGSAKIASPSALPAGIVQLIGVDGKQTDLTGGDLQQTTVTFDQNTGKPQVQLAFTANGAKKFAEITKRNVGKILPIVLDNQVVEAPRVNEAITGGSAVITGEFTPEQAKALSIQLNAGALPVSLLVLEQRAVGATLGNTSLQKSLIAGIIGFIVIVVFMVILYGKLGIVASIALFFYTLIVLAIFRLIPVTLTLAGIAGLILSIGIAVDANILIFERMREEIRKGRTKDIALALGFSRAWPSIRDSNVASLITSAILYYFGTGVVRGFALTLAIGVLISMFSAITLTRTFLQFLYSKIR